MGLLSDIRAEKHLKKSFLAEDLTSKASLSSLGVLSAVCKDAMPKLFNRIATSNENEYERGIEILSALVNDKNLPYITNGLSSDSHPRILNAAVDVLTASNDYDPSKLIELLDKPSISRVSLMKIMETKQDKLNVSMLLRKLPLLAPSERSALFRILDSVKDDSVLPELVQRVTAKDVNTRVSIINILRRYKSPDSVRALLGRLTDDSKRVRFEALDALSSMGVEVDVGILCTLIKDADYSVQTRAVDALIKRNDPRSIKYILELLQDESEYIRRGAVEVLNGMEYSGAIEDLLIALKDADWWVRARAADTLAKIGGSRVIAAVVQLIKSEDEYIRRSAVEILNSTRDETAMKHLMEALHDADWWVRERAIDALANIGNKIAIPALLEMMTKDQQAAPVVLRAMLQLGDESHVKKILPMIEEEDENIAVQALHTIAELVDTNAADTIIAAIKKRKGVAGIDVSGAAEEALARIDYRLARNTVETPRTRGAPPLSNDTLLGDAKKKNVASSSSQRVDMMSPAKPAASSEDDKSTANKAASVTPSTDADIDIRKLKTGDMISERYKYIRRVGKGAFSTVLLVEDQVIDEHIVLKVLHQKMSFDESVIKRFIRELRYARKINHQNVIRIFDFTKLSNLYIISMEYFPSLTLSAELESLKPLDISRAIGIGKAISSGIAAAHHLGIVHRDLKPGNVLIDNSDVVKIVDFGISAAHSTGDTRLTKTGILIGTPRYMAPEQVLGKPLDSRTDIYSLGVMMYEMLTGTVAFKGDDNMAVLYQHVHGNIDAVHKVNPDIPEPLSHIVSKMMTVKPENRYQTMEEVFEMLDGYKV